MAKAKKQSSTSKKTYGMRDVGVQLDRMEHEIKIVSEQHDDITKKLDLHGTKIDKLGEDMIVVKTDLHIMKTDIEFIKTGLKRKVDIEEFAALEQRVAALEKKR